MQCMFAKGLASTGWSQIPLWYIFWSADTLNLWQLLHSLQQCTVYPVRSAFGLLVPACVRQHCTSLETEETNSLRLTAWPIVFPCLLFPQPPWISALRHTVTALLDDAESGSLNSCLRCNASPIFFLHSSLLIIHSFIVSFLFHSFYYPSLNYGWYIDICYSRGRIQSYYGISINCAGLKHSVFFSL